MKISVLINTYNRREALGRTLAALAAQDCPLTDLEVLVLDDCGSDGSYALLLEREKAFLAAGFRAFRALRNEVNRGIAAGRARLTAEAAADSEALLYLDDDVYMEKSAVSRLAACLGRGARRGLAGPRLVYAWDPARTAHGANFVGRWSGRYYDSDPDSETACDWLNSSCFLVRREALAGVRHAEDFYTAHEEVDFCLQLGRNGWEIIYCPQARAAHDLPAGACARRDRLYYLYRNKFFVIRRNFPAPRRYAAYATALLLGLPRYLLDSVVFNKGLKTAELSLILRAVADGLAGRGGRL